jgi:tetratricopeptide (TPR) repeat protein
VLSEVEGETVAAWLRQGYENLGAHSEEVGAMLSVISTGMNPAAGLFLGLAGTMGVGLVQDKAVEAGAELDQRLQELATELEDSDDAKRARLGATLQRFTGLLPDSDQWERSIIRSLNGDPEDLVELLRTYQEDDRRRRRYERAFEAVVTGNVEEQTDEDEDFVDYLQSELDTDDRDEALAAFLDVQELLTAQKVHETLETLHGVEYDFEAIEEMIGESQRKLDSLLDARLGNEGFRRIDEHYHRLEPGEPDVERAIQRGFRPRDVAAGLAVERSVSLHTGSEGRSFEPADLATYLVEAAPGTDVLVRGRPGSGKTTYCLSVLREWYDEGYGTALYRRGGGTPLTNPGNVTEEIRRASGHVLVVVDDAVREDADGIFEVMDECENDRDVTFLLNARYSDLGNASPGGTVGSDADRQLRRTLQEISKADIEPLDEGGEDCAEIIDHFESLLDREFDYTGQTLYDSIRTESRAGEMLHLTYRLFGEGLQPDVRAKYETVETPWADGAPDIGEDLQRFDDDLRRTIGLFVNLLNVAENVEVRREYLYALAAVYEDVSVARVHELLKCLDGWLFFDFETGSINPQHEHWSFLYLEFGLPEDTEQEDGDEDIDKPPWWDEGESADDPGSGVTPLHFRFETCLDALFALLDPELDERAGIDHRTDNGELLNDIETDPDSVATRVIGGLFGIGSEYPVLEPLFLSSDDAVFSLAAWETCPPLAMGEAAIARGRMLEARGDLKTASEEYERALDWLDDAAVAATTTRSRALLGRGDVARTRGEFDFARERYSEALATAVSGEGETRTGTVANCLQALGRVALSRGRFERAAEFFERAHSIFSEIDDRRGEAESLTNLGTIARVSGDFDAAETYHHRALDIVREIGDRHGEATSLNSLGLIARGRREYETAGEYHDRSLAVFREIGARRGVAVSLNNLGRLARARGDLDAAEEHHDRALDIFRAVDDRQGVAVSFKNLGDVARTRGDLDVAEEYHDRSLAVGRDIGVRYDQQ